MSHQRSVSPVADEHVVGQGDYAPAIVQDARPAALIDYPDALADHEGRGRGGGQHVPVTSRRRAGRPAGNGGRRAIARRVNVMAHQPPPPPLSNYIPVVRPEVLYNYPPLTSRLGYVCNRRQVRECIDLLLELLGWGVPLEYIVDLGVSLPGVIWLCAKLRIRLPWAIVLKAHENRLPFHPESIMPLGYGTEFGYPPLV